MESAQVEAVEERGRAMARGCTSERHDQHDVYAAQCPCREVLDLLANKWSALAIGAMGTDRSASVLCCAV
ncbi:hypothetical protein [Streptomyces sp. Isolate_45]|uniref:hypothetical protein n=1 Tax=Streptomyces sp. Isolate_45 TaxID=2950111 RepID=UPI002481F5F6|nr:hypothetical protein [Streptomyces sp. Isolate_45]MDA5279292.1 hypothetical protein [Streptomyces sp. Isolate_45]